MGHDKLRVLELRKNKLTSCAGLMAMPMLTELYLNENELTNLEGLRDLACLRKLDLNANKITTIDAVLPNLPCLEHLDIGANLIEAPADGGISKFECYATTLKVLIVTGNPFADALADGVKKEVLLTIPGIQKVNEDEITAEDHEACKELKKEREKEAEEAAKAAAEKLAAGGAEGEGDEAKGEDED